MGQTTDRVISADLMHLLDEKGETFEMPHWSLGELALDGKFKAMGLFSQMVANADTQRERTPWEERSTERVVTVPADWSHAMLNGAFKEEIQDLLDIEAISIVERHADGRVTFRVETYPPDVRRELDRYRRDDGTLVIDFG